MDERKANRKRFQNRRSSCIRMACILSLCISLLISGCGTGSEGKNTDPERAEKIVEEMVVDHGSYGSEAKDRVDELLKELSSLDPGAGTRWQKIMDIWTSPELGQPLHYDILPSDRTTQEKLYSSCVVLSDGKIIHNYRRISKGWKEYSITDGHYCEGSDVRSFPLNGEDISLALCGDLWDYPDRFRTEGLLIWPVYVNYTPEEWNSGVLEEYAAQAALAAEDVLMVNPLDDDPENHGGSFHFHKGQIAAKLPFDREDILIVEGIGKRCTPD